MFEKPWRIYLLIASVLVGGVCGLAGLFAGPLAYDYAAAAISGPRIVRSAPSPDGEFEAYVEEYPSVDPPDQSLFVQRSDGVRFMHIADLAEDVDAIQEIHWSPHSDVVVFHTRAYLIATHVPGYQTVKIYLGQEWTRTEPDGRSTFNSGEVERQVAEIEFPKPGAFSYRLEGQDELHTVRIDNLTRH